MNYVYEGSITITLTRAERELWRSWMAMWRLGRPVEMGLRASKRMFGCARSTLESAIAKFRCLNLARREAWIDDHGRLRYRWHPAGKSVRCMADRRARQAAKATAKAERQKAAVEAGIRAEMANNYRRFQAHCLDLARKIYRPENRAKSSKTNPIKTIQRFEFELQELRTRKTEWAEDISPTRGDKRASLLPPGGAAMLFG